MDEETRNLDLLVAELESESNQLRQKLNAVLDENARLRLVIERVIAVTKLAYENQDIKPTKEKT
jgi:regulator of replication initiation timing